MSTLLHIAAWLWHALDVVSSPFVYVLVDLPAGVHPLLGLVPVSVLIGLVAVLLVGRLSNQQRLRRQRERMKGHLLGVLIFNHSLPGILRSLGRAVAASILCLREALVPVLIMFVPVLFVLGQVGQFYSHRPGPPGGTVRVSAYFATMPTDAELRADEELATSGPFMFSTKNMAVWEIVPPGEGEYDIDIVMDGEIAEKAVVVSAGWPCRISAVRTNGLSLVAGFVDPHERPLPLGSPLRRIEVGYPRAELAVFGRVVHWSIPVLIICVAAGWLFARWLHVQL